MDKTMSGKSSYYVSLLRKGGLLSRPSHELKAIDNIYFRQYLDRLDLDIVCRLWQTSYHSSISSQSVPKPTRLVCVVLVAPKPHKQIQWACAKANQWLEQKTHTSFTSMPVTYKSVISLTSKPVKINQSLASF